MTEPRPDWTGRTFELDVDAVGTGGVCVGRADGRVVFVRHALPGERVRVAVTEDAGGGFCRADAVEVLDPSPDRVEPPCRHAGPGRCGGCDWQHVSAEAQRRLKAAVVREQFARLAGIDLDLDTVEALPGGLLGWRTRVSFAIGADGIVGLHRHRSHEVEPVDDCPLGADAVRFAPAAVPRALAVENVVDDDGRLAVLAHTPGGGRQARGRRPPDRVSVLTGPAELRHRVGGRTLEVGAAGFWQVHPDAVRVFGDALLTAVRPEPGETALDLYAGAGPLTSLLADAVGPSGQVFGIESSRTAVADAERNLVDRPHASVRLGRVDARTLGALDELSAPDEPPDLIVLDPPRAGAGAATMRAILDLQPARIGYVSCDPATLARDVAVAVERGWRLGSLRAFDAFPMTAHVECVVRLEPS